MKMISLNGYAVTLVAAMAMPLAAADTTVAGGCMTAPIAQQAYPSTTVAAYVPADPMPPVQQAGGLRYVTGGIGSDSAASMRAVRNSYPVAMTFVYRDGGAHQFTAGVGVVIERPDGTSLLEVVTDGPYLFVDLPPGQYRMRARSVLGAPQHREFSVAADRRTEFTVVWAAPQ